MSPRSDHPPLEHGADGFSKAYWAANYNDPESMEGIANAREHVAYLKAFFELEDVEVESIVDLGCGLGHLFQDLVACAVAMRVVDRLEVIQIDQHQYIATPLFLLAHQ